MTETAKDIGLLVGDEEDEQSEASDEEVAAPRWRRSPSSTTRRWVGSAPSATT